MILIYKNSKIICKEIRKCVIILIIYLCNIFISKEKRRTESQSCVSAINGMWRIGDKTENSSLSIEIRYMDKLCFISENSRKLYIADRANDVHCNFPPEALMNTVSSYEATY